MSTAVTRTAPAPGTRGSKDQSPNPASDLNFVDILLAVGVKPLAEFMKGRKTAAGAVMAILAYAVPLQDAFQGSEFSVAINLFVAILQFGAAWFGGGGLVSWALAARRVGRLLT